MNDLAYLIRQPKVRHLRDEGASHRPDSFPGRRASAQRELEL